MVESSQTSLTQKINDNRSKTKAALFDVIRSGSTAFANYLKPTISLQPDPIKCLKKRNKSLEQNLIFGTQLQDWFEPVKKKIKATTPFKYFAS
ncbi:hypothetical protein BRARA_B02512 [Brassica rapa]|uniref:Uncharacterized protein n=1 Tax=Brassica campestris TaxID=3711 RepID=A0A398ACH4_BRACM|nr:hypothetical protein BRARA_B02512 [Brassica rapa]